MQAESALAKCSCTTLHKYQKSLCQLLKNLPKLTLYIFTVNLFVFKKQYFTTVLCHLRNKFTSRFNFILKLTFY